MTTSTIEWLVLSAFARAAHVTAIVRVHSGSPRAGDEVVCRETGAGYRVAALFTVSTDVAAPGVVGVTLLPAAGIESIPPKGSHLVSTSRPCEPAS
jgi:hypothetical protein